MGKYFGTDGFRGEAGITLTADHAYKEPAAYAILDKEFGGNKHIEKVNIREKINLKHESVSLDDRKENEQNGSDDGADFKNEVIIKSGVIQLLR